MVVNLTGSKSTPLKEFTLATLETLSTMDNTSQAMIATFSERTDRNNNDDLTAHVEFRRNEKHFKFCFQQKLCAAGDKYCS